MPGSVLPAVLGRTAPGSFAPRNASLVFSGFTFAVIVAYAVGGADPLVQLFYWLGTGGGFGILLLLVGTSLSVPCYFFLRRRRGTGQGRVAVWQGYLAPIVAAAALGWIAWLIFDNFAGLLNVAPDSPMRWAFPIGYGILALLGAVWALVLYLDRPAVYNAIGLGITPSAAQDSGAAAPAYAPAHSSTPGSLR